MHYKQNWKKTLKTLFGNTTHKPLPKVQPSRLKSVRDTSGQKSPTSSFGIPIPDLLPIVTVYEWIAFLRIISIELLFWYDGGGFPPGEGGGGVTDDDDNDEDIGITEQSTD